MNVVESVAGEWGGAEKVGLWETAERDQRRPRHLCHTGNYVY